jgi:bifunctional non-homologous end joining protein LigD
VFPNNLKPMPLQRHRKPFSHPDWVFEIKHDGFRALALVVNGKCRLVSRNGNPFSSFKVLASYIPTELNCERAVLDGEIVCLDEQGRSQFEELLFRRGEPRFFAFDLLYCEGKDLRFDALSERKRQLRALVTAERDRLLFCDHIEERGEDLFRFVCEHDLEGMVAKPKNSPYLFSESETHWLKIRNQEYSQWNGREELFNPARPEEAIEIDGWAGCTLACAEAEL